jgi:SAM-dependent methyltransferase
MIALRAAKVVPRRMLAGIRGALVAYHHRAIAVPRVRRVAEALTGLIDARGGAATLLDVGSGNGLIARRVATALGADVIGVDVRLQPSPAIEVLGYDGRVLPFDDASHDVVLLSDVLHHADDPGALLAECVRVSRFGVAVKDHLSFGAVSSKLLEVMDHVGNADNGVAVTGRYFSTDEWFAMVNGAGGQMTSMRWPLLIHDLPWRIATRSELQFASFVEPRSASRGTSS